jgi:hypothetical protein
VLDLDDRLLAAGAGPLTRTSHSSTPCLRAAWRPARRRGRRRRGALAGALEPTVPADAHDSVSPLVSVMVIIVLLNVALMWAIAAVTPLRTCFFGRASRRAVLLVLPWSLASFPRGSSGLTAVPAGVCRCRASTARVVRAPQAGR